MNDLADKIEQQIYLRYGPWCDIGLERKEWQQIIAALRRGRERPPSGEMTYLVDGKEMKLCDCPAREGKCPRGVERRLLTTELSRCLLPR